MFLLMDAHSGFPVHYNNSDEKKSGQTIHSCSMRVPYAGLWAVIYSVITRVLIAHAHRWDLNSTCWYLFKLNSCKLCQFKHLRARGRELTHAVRRFVRALIRSTQTRLRTRAHQKRANPRLGTRANMKLSLKYRVWMDKFTQKLCQNARLGKYPSRHSRLNVQYQCILLKWQHFLNINQTATTKKSLTALDWIAFVTLIKINL